MRDIKQLKNHFDLLVCFLITKTIGIKSDEIQRPTYPLQNVENVMSDVVAVWEIVFTINC